MPDLFAASDAVQQARRMRPAAVGMPFKVVALNLQNAGAERYDLLHAYLQSCDADLLVLTELKEKPATSDFLQRLALGGYADADLSSCGPRAYHATILRSLQGTALPVKTESLRSRAAITRLSIAGADPLYVIGLYVPAFNEENQAERDRFFKDLDEKVLARLVAGKANILLTGDLNIVEPAFHDHLPEFVRECRSRFAVLGQHGLRDVMRERAQDQPHYTWMSPMSGQGQRLDYVFASETVCPWIETVEIDHGPRAEKLSDHSALHITVCPEGLG